MFKRFSQLLMLVAILASLNFHWGLIQAAAWANMIVDYSKQTHSVSKAIDMTFNGKNPCKLCHVVKDGLNDLGEGGSDYNRVSQPEIVLLVCDLNQTLLSNELLFIKVLDNSMIPFCCLPTSPEIPPPRLVA